MANLSFLLQIEPRVGYGVVLKIKPGMLDEVLRVGGGLAGLQWESIDLCRAGELYDRQAYHTRLTVKAGTSDCICMISGWKRPGFWEWFERVEKFAPYLEDALVYAIGEDPTALHEYRFRDGKLLRRVAQNRGNYIEDFEATVLEWVTTGELSPDFTVTSD